MNCNSARTSVTTGLLLSAAAFFAGTASGKPPEKTSIESAPRLGQFDQMAMGIFNPLPEDFSTDVVYDLPYVEGWIVAEVRDRKGVQYKAFMTIHPNGKADFHVQETSPTGVILDPRTARTKGLAINRRFEPGKGMRLTLAGQDITLGAKDAVWTTTDGMMNIKARVATAAMHYLLPWRESDGKTSSILYYTSQYFVVESGTLYGEPVKGFIVFDQSYSKAPYAQTVLRLEGSWTGFTNQYDDGTIEMGHFVCGQGAMRAALVTDGKGRELYNSPHIKLDVKYQADQNYPDRILFTLGNGEKWQYIHDPNGNLDILKMSPELSASPAAMALFKDFRTNTGQVTRVGEKRKVVAWWSDTEMNRKNLCAGR